MLSDMVVFCFLLGTREEHFNKRRALHVCRFVCAIHKGIIICTVQAAQSLPALYERHRAGPGTEPWLCSSKFGKIHYMKTVNS